MQKIIRFGVISFVSFCLLVIFFSKAFAYDFVVPLPQGKLKITNDYNGHNDYLHFQQYSLDFQAGEIPADVKTEETETRCYSYGMPILASRDGEVISVVNTARQEEKKDKYGASVNIKHTDGSIAIYGHMIKETPGLYAKKGDQIIAGQIL